MWPLGLRLDVAQTLVPLLIRANASVAPARDGKIRNTALDADMLRALANMCSGPPEELRQVQDLVREMQGLPCVLNFSLVLDARNPSVRREWALFALRQLCIGNEENQQAVADLRNV